MPSDPIAAWFVAQGWDPIGILFAIICATVMAMGISLALELRSKP